MDNKTVIVHSPGRINIIGEHTDYNDGFVLPAAINKKSAFKLTKNQSKSQVNMHAKDLNEKFSFELDSFAPINHGWQNYVMGVVDELQKIGKPLTGFNGEFESDVPIGAGMSSSAALECSLAYGLNELFDLKLDYWQLIKVGQMAEHNFVGIKCGIMDQFASVMGKKDHVILLDTRSLSYKYIPFSLGEYRLLLLNSNVSHTLANSSYNKRRAECYEAVDIIKKEKLDVESLRDVTIDNLKEISSVMPDNLLRRSRHVVSENHRVLESIKALSINDFKTLGKLLYSSHYSLKHDYKVSCPEIDYLVDLSLENKNVLGSRMMGGGFGGCTINIVHEKSIDSFIESSSTKYFNRFDIELTPHIISIEDGIQVNIS